MSRAGKKLLRAGLEAVAVARGERPAARITIKGHTYVPLEEYARLRAATDAAIKNLRHRVPNIEAIRDHLQAAYQQQVDKT